MTVATEPAAHPGVRRRVRRVRREPGAAGPGRAGGVGRSRTLEGKERCRILFLDTRICQASFCVPLIHLILTGPPPLPPVPVNGGLQL